jgi:ATP-dependent Clp protease ATP-binding subunit ClpA
MEPVELTPSDGLLSESCRQIVLHAVGVAMNRHHEYVGGFIRLIGSGSAGLGKVRIQIAYLLAMDLSSTVSDGETDPQPTAAFHRVIKRGHRLARRLGESETSELELLLAILEEKRSDAAKILNDNGITKDRIMRYIERHIMFSVAIIERHKYIQGRKIINPLTSCYH